MEIPGIAPLSGQPTLTNPLSQERLLEGRETVNLRGSETHYTEIVRGQKATMVSSAEIVTQAEQTVSTGLDTHHFGSTIDITV